MALPLYLAMTAPEMSARAEIPQNAAWMACHFSPSSQGLSNLPPALPEGRILILNDRLPCQGHSADLVAGQLRDTVSRLGCTQLLLDLQRPPEAESLAIVKTILAALPCPVIASETYAREFDCPVFLPPCPLHEPLEAHLAPWNGREIWLEAALCQEEIIITEAGTSFHACFPPDGLTEGFFDPELCCNYKAEITADRIRFTLFDTPDTLKEKIKKAQALGVSRAVGLYQELWGLS